MLKVPLEKRELIFHGHVLRLELLQAPLQDVVPDQHGLLHQERYSTVTSSPCEGGRCREREVVEKVAEISRWLSLTLALCEAKQSQEGLA